MYFNKLKEIILECLKGEERGEKKEKTTILKNDILFALVWN